MDFWHYSTHHAFDHVESLGTLVSLAVDYLRIVWLFVKQHLLFLSDQQLYLYMIFGIVKGAFDISGLDVFMMFSLYFYFAYYD